MRQTLELALDWIKKQPEETPDSKYDVDTRYVVIREIEAALAQPELDYERGFIDGMQKQMQSSVDKAVNRLAQPEQEYGVVAGVGKGVEIPAGVKYYYIEPKLPPQPKEPEQEPLTGGDERRHIICLCPDCTTPPQRKPLTDAALHLSNLVEALDNAFISSWQSTHHWQKQLDDAREYLTAHGIKE